VGDVAGDELSIRCPCGNRRGHKMVDRVSRDYPGAFSELVHLVIGIPGLLCPEGYDRLNVLFCLQSSLLVFGISVGNQLDQVPIGVTHVQTGPRTQGTRAGGRLV
jgi:hypothetical protein